MREWLCNKCGDTYLDAEHLVPADKVCLYCKGLMKKITSTGQAPAASIKEVLARDDVKKLAGIELVSYLKFLGFSDTEISRYVNIESTQHD